MLVFNNVKLLSLCFRMVLFRVCFLSLHYAASACSCTPEASAPACQLT